MTKGKLKKKLIVGSDESLKIRDEYINQEIPRKFRKWFDETGPCIPCDVWNCRSDASEIVDVVWDGVYVRATLSCEHTCDCRFCNENGEHEFEELFLETETGFTLVNKYK